MSMNFITCKMTFQYETLNEMTHHVDSLFRKHLSICHDFCNEFYHWESLYKFLEAVFYRGILEKTPFQFKKSSNGKPGVEQHEKVDRDKKPTKRMKM